MGEIIIANGSYPGASQELLPEDEARQRLGLIGCVDLVGNVDLAGNNRVYPLPLFSVDQKIIPEAVTTGGMIKINRVQGLVAKARGFLVRGSWTGMVDLPDGVNSGEGSVYLGHGSYPDEAIGYIFNEKVPYEPDKQLAYVRQEPADVTVLHVTNLRGEPYHLVYEAPDKITSLQPFEIDQY